ncbi:IclR family transcriptional regulator [Neptuniibacter sp. 1_MG-2023]|uniref:IclR family transcriptional regulator n=1 Tax=Neptuniibacter sp. 1_MG-2023 TaxID=3062662 RepID=UPI0026E3BCDB|nr:IclR family transcriptional regulator [Neptuniibacter sp. 1_MG-2023]MDO6594807.1 IclR family transcriptional regulator [Neptuniibacter sp. 1_MG-2023]
MSSAIDRAFTVLECFGQHRKPLRLADVVSDVNLPKQSVHRIIKQLEGLGLLERDVHPEKFRLGHRMRQLGISTIVSLNQSLSTHAVLKELGDTFQETVNIGILEQNEVIYIDRVECDWPLRVQLNPGSRVKSHCTAIGKLLLAYLPESILNATLQNMTLEAYTPKTITDPELLLAECHKIKKQGYAENIGEDIVGLVALAVPIFDQRNNVIAGLAVHAPDARTSLAAMRKNIDNMRSTADKLQTLLSLD